MTREEMSLVFGPMLIEAIVLVVKDEINILRASQFLPEHTDQQIMDAIETKIDGLAKYDRMS